MPNRNFLIIFLIFIIIFSLLILKIGYIFIHSGIFILLILSPGYFFFENKGAISHPEFIDIIIYIFIQIAYYSSLMIAFTIAKRI